MGIDRTIDITAEQRDTILRLLNRYLPGTAAWVYGSRAKWTSRPQSDLDLVVFAKPGQSSQVAALREAFEESDLPFRVDLFVWDKVPESFRPEIEREHVVLVSAQSSVGEELIAKQLGSNTIIVMGQSPAGDTCNIHGEGVPLLNGPTEFGSHHPEPVQFTTDPRKLAQPGDLLFCVRGSTTGRMNWADQQYAIGRGIAAIRHKSGAVLQPFVRAAVEFSLPDILTQATGSTFPNVSARQLMGLWWPPLTLPEQRAIAHVLGTLDDKIELNRRMNETLEAMARAIFKDWFVDFGPTRAKMEGQEPYLPPEIWNLFPDALDDEGKPEGWLNYSARDLFEFNPHESLRKGTDAPYLDMAALPTVGLAASLPGRREYKSGSKFKDGDTLFARITPCLENGKTAYVFGLGDKVIGAGSTEFIVIRSRTPVPQPASYFLARDPEFRAHAERSMTGTSGRQRARFRRIKSAQGHCTD